MQGALLGCGKRYPSGAPQFRDLTRSESLKESEALKSVMSYKALNLSRLMNHSNMHSVSQIQDLSGTLIKTISVMLIGNIMWLVFPLKRICC